MLLTSPRLRGEVAALFARRVRGCSYFGDLIRGEKPLTPALSERASLVSAPQDRGEGAYRGRGLAS
jgi:hypothetical protein